MILIYWYIGFYWYIGYWWYIGFYQNWSCKCQNWSCKCWSQHCPCSLNLPSVQLQWLNTGSLCCSIAAGFSQPGPLRHSTCTSSTYHSWQYWQSEPPRCAAAAAATSSCCGACKASSTWTCVGSSSSSLLACWSQSLQVSTCCHKFRSWSFKLEKAKGVNLKPCSGPAAACARAATGRRSAAARASHML